MKLLFICLTMVLSTSTYAITKEDAKQLVDFNEKSFSKKELINNPDLCEFHNSLIKISEQKKEKLQCNNRNASPDTKDNDLVKQMSGLTNSMAVMDMQHPESEMSPNSINDYAIQKMKAQGFNK